MVELDDGGGFIGLLGRVCNLLLTSVVEAVFDGGCGSSANRCFFFIYIK